MTPARNDVRHLESSQAKKAPISTGYGHSTHFSPFSSFPADHYFSSRTHSCGVRWLLDTERAYRGRRRLQPARGLRRNRAGPCPMGAVVLGFGKRSQTGRELGYEAWHPPRSVSQATDLFRRVRHASQRRHRRDRADPSARPSHLELNTGGNREISHISESGAGSTPRSSRGSVSRADRSRPRIATKWARPRGSVP